MSGNLFQFDEYQQQEHQQSMNIDTTAVGGELISFFLCFKLNFVFIDIRDYLTCDLKLSDTALNDFFSEFDINPSDFPYFDPSANTNTTYLQQTVQAPFELPPPPYDAALLSTSTNEITNNTNIQPVIDEYLPSDALDSLIEQHQVQQTIVKYSSSPPPIVLTNYPEVIQTKISSEKFYFFFILDIINFINEYVRISIK